MRGINKVILIGNLGQDPEIRYTVNGNAVANISLATSETWRDKQSGELKERTEWHRVVLFGKLAEVAGEFLKKGSQIYIEGNLQTRKWQDQNGQDRYTTEIVVNMNGTMQMLGSRNISSLNKEQSNVWENISNENSKFSEEHTRNKKKNLEEKKISEIENKTLEDFDDDIPF